MSNDHKILYFCSSSVFGGAERFIETSIQEHTKNGDNVIIYFLNSGYFFDRLKSAGHNVHLSRTKVKLKNPFSWIRFQFEFYRFIKKHDVTHVHATMAYSQIFSAVATKLSCAKQIWFQHGPIGGLIDKIANILSYDHLIFNSSYTRQEHISKAGKIKSKHTILPLVVSPHFSMESSQNIRSHYKGELFISMGRICRWKGYENALKALSKYDGIFDLLIVGMPSTDDDKVYLLELKELVCELELSSKVHFLGFKENIYDYLKASDALIHCSTTPEPFGLVVAEAKALSVYVYATEIGGIIDQLDNNNLGVMYSPTNPCEDLLRLLSQRRHLVKINNNRELDQVSEMVSSLNNIYSTEFTS